MVYFLIGSPLSGKSTISKTLINKYGFKYFSTGDFARENGMKSDRIIGEYDLDLDLDDKIRQRVVNIATRSDNYIIDGFPRSVDQIMDILNNNINFKIIFMFVNPVTMYKRAQERNRDDDKIDKVAQRSRASHRLFKNLKSILGDEILFFDGDIDDISRLEDFINA